LTRLVEVRSVLVPLLLRLANLAVASGDVGRSVRPSLPANRLSLLLSLLGCASRPGLGRLQRLVGSRDRFSVERVSSLDDLDGCARLRLEGVEPLRVGLLVSDAAS
jgi:hypothetical protein